MIILNRVACHKDLCKKMICQGKHIYDSIIIIKDIVQRFNEMNFTWREILSSGKSIKINNYQMLQMHKKACEALREYVPQNCESKTIVLGIEQYLSENIRYDYQAIKNKSHTHSTKNYNDQVPSIV